MINNSIIPILIIIFSLLIIFYILNFKNNNMYKKYIEEFNIIDKNNWIILLTTCVKPQIKKFNNIEHNEKELNERKDLYIKQINKWLNETNFKIVVVDSSGYTFPEINNKNLIVISFILDNKYDSSSQYEANSIVYAIDKIKEMDFFKNCTHILKITGRYFLENIDSALSNIEQFKDLYLQYHRQDELKWQNTEYFGIKKELILPMLYPILNNGLMENNLYNFSTNKNYSFIGKFKNDVRRGGDNLLIEEL